MGPRTSPNDKGPQKTQENSSLWSPFLSCFCSTQWNKIEHRMFCHITQNWRATPLTSRLAVVELIANTTTKTGLTIRCELDTNTYPKGIKVRGADGSPKSQGRRIPSRLELLHLTQRSDCGALISGRCLSRFPMDITALLLSHD